MRAHDDPGVEAPDVLLAALEHASDAVVIVDGDFHVRFFNAAAELIWDLDRAEVLGRDASYLGLDDLQLHPVAKPASGQVNGEDAIQGHSSEIKIQRKDGSRIRAALSLSRVAVGGQSHTIAFVRDITAELGLREREALLTLVADRTNRAVVVTDPDLGIVYSNAAFTELFGYSAEEARGLPVNELLVGRHTDRRTLARLRRRIREESGGEEEVLAYDRNGDGDLDLGECQDVPQPARADQVHIRPADRYHRDQAVTVAAAVDHEHAGR